MSIKSDVYVVNVIKSGAAFAVREDTGEGVYIPPAIARSADIRLSDCVDARLVKNRQNKASDGGTPWLMVRGFVVEDD
jgi:hypothetical protein